MIHKIISTSLPHVIEAGKLWSMGWSHPHPDPVVDSIEITEYLPHGLRVAIVLKRLNVTESVTLTILGNVVVIDRH